MMLNLQQIILTLPIYGHKESQVSFCETCTVDNVTFVAAGHSICNHIKTCGAGVIIIIRQLYLI